MAERLEQDRQPRLGRRGAWSMDPMLRILRICIVPHGKLVSPEISSANSSRFAHALLRIDGSSGSPFDHPLQGPAIHHQERPEDMMSISTVVSS